MYDLIVIGGGPSGSYLSSKASENGMNVILLEKGEIGSPLACSGHVSEDVWDFIQTDPDDLIQNEIRGARFHIKDKKYEFYKDKTVSYAIDRVSLDQKLAEQAEENGVEVLDYTEATAININSKEVTVDSTEGSFKSFLVAGCDGPTSFVRDSIGIENPDHLFRGILGYYSREKGGGDFVDVYLDFPDFFGWRIPRGNSVEYGAACSQNIRHRFEKIVAEKAARRNGVEKKRFMDQLEFHAGIIPIGTPDKITHKRAFLVGDSAAQTKPFTGGGIVYGMSAARIAANTIDPDNPTSLVNYERKWRKEFAREIYLGKILRECYNLPSPLQRLCLSLFQGRINVHMDKPSTIFNIETFKKILSNMTKSI